MEIIFIGIISIYSYYFMKSVLKNTPGDCQLTAPEKIRVIITLLLNTPLSWAIYYLGWKNKLPTKAKQVNKYIRNIILVIITIGIISIILLPILSAINPPGHMPAQ
jgi:hypothetical protein